jgi:hypothetical protein
MPSILKERKVMIWKDLADRLKNIGNTYVLGNKPWVVNLWCLGLVHKINNCRHLVLRKLKKGIKYVFRLHRQIKIVDGVQLIGYDD